MSIEIKKVVLGRGATSATSRRGAFFRVLDTETGRRSYYRATKAVAPTKAKALDRFSVSQQARVARLAEKARKTIEEKKEVAELEDATLHFRLDYTGDARSGHQFQIRDSHITAQVPKGMSDQDARDYLRGLFREAFSDQFGGALTQYIDDDEMVEGLERGAGNATGIRIKYNYGAKGGWKVADAKVGIVKDIQESRERFFYGTLKRSRK